MMKLKRSIATSERNGHRKDITNMGNCLMLFSGESSSNRVFECKTCNRKFPSFQALGGHRASHKKPRLMTSRERSLSPPKPKSHECSICGIEFPIGQALGGHMRRHRAAAPPHAPIFKKSNTRTILCLDLNLTPSQNKFLFGNFVPTVDCLY